MLATVLNNPAVSIAVGIVGIVIFALFWKVPLR